MQSNTDDTMRATLDTMQSILDTMQSSLDTMRAAYESFLPGNSGPVEPAPAPLTPIDPELAYGKYATLAARQGLELGAIGGIRLVERLRDSGYTPENVLEAIESGAITLHGNQVVIHRESSPAPVESIYSQFERIATGQGLDLAELGGRNMVARLTAAGYRPRDIQDAIDVGAITLSFDGNVEIHREWK